MCSSPSRWSFWIVDFTINFFFLLDCTHYSDCPNGGQNYECIDELCTCAPGHTLDGDACVGMLPIFIYFYMSSRALFFQFLPAL